MPFFICFLLALIVNIASLFGQQDSSSSNKTIIVLPVISRSIETGWAFGAATSYTLKNNRLDTLSRTSNVQALVLYSLRKQFVAAINGTIYFPNEKYILSSQLSLSSFPDNFWGIGSNAPAKNEEPYTFKQYYIYGHLERRVLPHIYLGMLYEFQHVYKVTYQTGGLFDKQQVEGRFGYKVSGLGGSITWDSRNHAFTPNKGYLIQFFFNHFANYFGSDYKYTNYVVDIRDFIKIYKTQVLALQLYGFFNKGTVPLRSLASMGGSNSMRGYYDGRYRDKNQLILQAEYRFPLFWRFGAVVFGNSGDVSSSISNFSLNQLKYSYGAGARFLLSKKENLNLRIDYGIGQQKSSGVYIQLGEVF